jgi:co-chaperonin GroES (HSP10)
MNIEEQKEIQIPQNLVMNTSGQDGVYDKKVHLNDDSKALNDLVIIKIIEQEAGKGIRDGIHIPDAALVNIELIKGEVVDAGPAAKQDGVSVGDVILYDKFSAFYKPPTTPGTFIITRCGNVIVKFPSESKNLNA